MLKFVDMKKIILLSLCASLFFGSCVKEESSDVKQDKIYTIYELFYNSNTDKTTAQATFRFGGPGGTLLELTSPAYAKFNNDNLLFSPVLGIHKKEYAGIVSSGNYTYLDHDDNFYTNSLTMVNSIAFPSADSIKNDQAYNFSWVGDPVGTNETVTLTVNGSQQGNIEIFATTSPGATEIILAANKLQKLGIGKANCILHRTYNKPTVAEAPAEGGRMAVWYAATKDIIISN